MDVQKFNFSAKLLEIITAISESHFVSFDLELSGVPVRPFGARESGKPSLQKRYTETKAAAEKYTILQVGLTCVKEDPIDGTYEFRPYNIHVSPLISERLDIDRDFSFHTGAVTFLNGVGFNFQAPLAIGVPYLSEAEARLARDRAKERLTRSKDSHPPLELKPEETESLAFLERVRAVVRKWQKTGKPDRDALYLGSRELREKELPMTASPDRREEQLSRFERRLVHQVVRSDFPGLITGAAGSGAVQVMWLDEEREAKFQKQRLREVNERIRRQKGFAWIVEALVGRSMAKLDPRMFMDRVDEEGNVSTQTYVSFDVKATFDRARSFIEGKPKPLMGHNLFLDLVYFYKHFVDELPDTVEEFQDKVHQLFPLVVDTKYLATHECGDINPMSSLQQLAEQLDDQESPIITTHQAHVKYADLSAHHEAGYDSMLTAQVAVRLSAKLEAERRTGEEVMDSANKSRGSESDSDPTTGGVQLHGNSVTNGHRRMLGGSDNEKHNTQLPLRGVPKGLAPTPASSRFAHGTAFEILQDGDGAIEEVLDFESLPTEGEEAFEEQMPQWGEGAPVVEPLCPGETLESQWTPFRLMPRWKTDFWREYGNRLRVFGTQESMCMLDPARDNS